MRRLAFGLFILAASACRRDTPSVTSIVDASEDAPAEASTAASVDAGPAQPEKPPFRRFDPAGRFIHASRTAGGLAVNDVKPEPLTPEQAKKVDAIAKALAESDDPPTAAIHALRDDLVAGVKAGRLDDAKLKARRAELVTAMAPLFGAERLALDELHRVLTPAQRAYATLGRNPSRGLAVSGHVTTELCRSWTKELALPDAKKKQIEAALPAPQALSTSFEQRMNDVADAFEKNEFEAKKIDVLDPKKKAVLPLDVETEFLRKVVPLLDEPSRKVVAERLANEDVSKLRD